MKRGAKLRRLRRRIKYRFKRMTNRPNSPYFQLNREEVETLYRQNQPKRYIRVNGEFIVKVYKEFKTQIGNAVQQIQLSVEELFERRKEKYLNKIRNRLQYV